MKYFTSLLFIGLTLFFFSCADDSKPDAAEKPTVSETAKSLPLTEAEINEYTTKGKDIAQASFKALAGKLKKAMQSGGPTKAVKFCNLNAAIIVDSLEKAHNAKIRRTTNQLRNPANAPTSSESAQLAAYTKAIADKQPLKPHVQLTEDNKVAFYAPIKMIKPVCLKCHGTVGETMKQEHVDLIKGLYPNDKAMGYELNQFRGIWSIEFDR